MAASRRCVGEQGVQIEALSAALSNLQDHYSVTKTAFESAQVTLFYSFFSLFYLSFLIHRMKKKEV